MTLNRRWAVFAGCVLAGLAVSAPAQAASSGVHVDPNSPAGKEYAIPLQTARSEGSAPAASAPASTSAGSSGNQSKSSPATPPSPADSGLFGAGISRPSRAHRTRTKAKSAASAVTPPPVFTAADRRSASGGGGGGGSTATFWVGAALAVLIPGLAVGLGVRRWRQA